MMEGADVGERISRLFLPGEGLIAEIQKREPLVRRRIAGSEQNITDLFGSYIDEERLHLSDKLFLVDTEGMYKAMFGENLPTVLHRLKSLKAADSVSINETVANITKAATTRGVWMADDVPGGEKGYIQAVNHQTDPQTIFSDDELVKVGVHESMHGKSKFTRSKEGAIYLATRGFTRNIVDEAAFTLTKEHSLLDEAATEMIATLAAYPKLLEDGLGYDKLYLAMDGGISAGGDAVMTRSLAASDVLSLLKAAFPKPKNGFHFLSRHYFHSALDDFIGGLRVEVTRQVPGAGMLFDGFSEAARHNDDEAMFNAVEDILELPELAEARRGEIRNAATEFIITGGSHNDLHS